MDYQGNAKKNKPEAKPEKMIEKVVVGEVVVHKKSIGRRFKDIFIEADFGSVSRYVISDILIPAAKNMIVDSVSKGASRMMYGEQSVRRGQFGTGPRITYNNPVNRNYESRPYSGRMAPPINTTSRTRQTQEDLILSSREEAADVLEKMIDIIDVYEVVSVADLNKLLGLPGVYTDNNWGWAYLGGVQIRQVREGFIIDFPPAESIQ